MKKHKKVSKTDESNNMKATRDGFGAGIVLAAKKNKAVVALTADLCGPTRLTEFAKQYPERFYDVGVAEQNLVTVASGLAHVGMKPFAASFAAFSPGRNWEQIRTTICYNDQNVKIVATHAGVGVGEDGATHQALEDVALMTVLPNMVVVEPCDAHQAQQATLALARHKGPGYLRLHRQKTPDLTTPKLSFHLGKAQIVRKGSDVTLVASGPVLHEVIQAAILLEEKGVDPAVINVHTIKPLDVTLIRRYAKKTGVVVVVQDHQQTGGLGSGIAQDLASTCPVPVVCIGIDDTFGQSGSAKELYEVYALTARHIARRTHYALRKK